MASTTPTLYKGHLIIENDPRIEALMPHAKKIVQDGRVFAVVPHKLDEHRVLRNLGYDIAPPILTDYQWPIVDGFQPFDAQRYTAAMIAVNDVSYVLNDLGTGKTRASLFAFDYLKSQGIVHKALVVAPLSTLVPTWKREVAKTYLHMKCNVLHGSADKRHKLLAEDADIYVVNHHGLEIIEEALSKRPDIDMIIYDELTVLKNQKTDLWKCANRVFRFPHLKRLTGMTGLLTPQAPTDAYGALKAFTPRVLQGLSFGRFRDQTMRKITNFRWLPRHDANETVFRMAQPSVRFTRDQCVDLPPCQYVDYECALSAEQQKLFKQLKNEFAAQLASGEITVANEADKINKMLQVILGCVYQADGSVAYLDCGPRLKVLDEITDATHGKLIVFTPYKHSLKVLSDHYGTRNVSNVHVSGDTPVGERNRIFQAFQDDPTLRVLVAHPVCMSHGLTLTEASTIAWWGLPPSVEVYEQANARITRPGQKRHQYIAHIVATSLEKQRYRQLESKIDTAGLLMEMVKNQQLSEVL
jgi:superfamily II DNA or RNA helicase